MSLGEYPWSINNGIQKSQRDECKYMHEMHVIPGVLDGPIV
jgi:hypothetical protein